MLMMPASCLAAAAVLLCLNLASGHSPQQAMFPDSNKGTDDAFFNSAPRRLKRSADSCENTEEMVKVGSDMVMTKDQHKTLTEGAEGRAAGKSLFRPWTGGIVPYQILPNHFTPWQLNWIQRAMQNWQKFSCVQFVDASTLPNATNMLVIQNGTGCSAVMGMAGGKQHVILGNMCFWKGTIEHELGHALGLIHEHQRPNRDNYLIVNYFAADGHMLFDLVRFKRGSDNKYGLPYDYHSVMHYTKSTFSKTWDMVTMHPRMTNKTDVIGQTLGPSFLDYKLINLMYNCKAKCSNPPVCPEPCFVSSDCGCVCENDMGVEVCGDIGPHCKEEAARGDCKTQNYMHHKCRKSCGVCKEDGSVPQLPCVDVNPDCTAKSCGYLDSARFCEETCGLCVNNSVQALCEDKSFKCREWAEAGKCAKYPDLMLLKCKRSCGFCRGEPLPQEQCQDYDTVCDYFKAMGGCSAFPAVMTQDCPKACGNCDNNGNKLSVSAHCTDSEPGCFRDAWEGKCSSKATQCRRSCNLCPLTPEGNCQDMDWFCPLYIQSCSHSPYVVLRCPKTCNLCRGHTAI